MQKPLRQAVRLPKGWKTRIRSAVLEVISLAKYSLMSARGWSSEKQGASGHWKSECERLQNDLGQVREELRIKDARMAHLPPHRRPHYPPRERMAILELRAARSWSLAQTARAFLVTETTVSSWMHRLEEQGPEALVQLPEPVNKFPEFVHYLVRRLQTLCPSMGKKRIAETLARAGLHLGATTVGRIRKAQFQPTTPATQSRVSRRHRQIRESRLEHRLNDGPDGQRILDDLEAVFIAPALAVLLVGRGHPGSLLAPRDGCGHVSPATQLEGDPRISWPHYSAV